MIKIHRITQIAALLVFGMLGSCGTENDEEIEVTPPIVNNPVSYFEIPVADIDRAVSFYESVFSSSLERTSIDGVDMALFPFVEDGTGASGALAAGESYIPSKEGPRIYFAVNSIDLTLSRVVSEGGRIAYPKTSIGQLGWVAEFEDTEGNLIALHSSSE